MNVDALIWERGIINKIDLSVLIDKYNLFFRFFFLHSTGKPCTSQWQPLIFGRCAQNHIDPWRWYRTGNFGCRAANLQSSQCAAGMGNS